LRYGAQTPFSDQLAFHWAGSLWQYDAHHDSILTVGNGGTKPAQALLTLYYNQGAGKYQMQRTLEPGDQMWVDVGNLVREHAPDMNGSFLPENVSSGSYSIRELGTGVGSLFEGKVVYDKTYGEVTYGCAACCAYKAAMIRLLYNPLGIPYGQQADQGIEAWDTCSDLWEDITLDFFGTWATGNTGIATVDVAGTHTGVSPGSTTTYTGPTDEQVQTLWNKCPIMPVGPSGGDNVMPTISGPSTLWWFPGVSGSVSGYPTEITLTANATAGPYQWAVTSGSYAVSLSSSTSSTVQVTSIGMSNSPNDVSITVTAGGVTSDPFKITVRTPYMLVPDPDYPSPVYAQDPTYVWTVAIHYQILDQLTTPLPSPISVNESWTTGIYADYQGENWRRADPNCDSADNSGRFYDLIGGETPDRTPQPVYNTQWNGAAVYHWGQEFRVATCTIGSGRRVQADTIQKYIDHGAHTNIFSPDP
jgi:hypothetical protein